MERFFQWMPIKNMIFFNGVLYNYFYIATALLNSMKGTIEIVKKKMGWVPCQPFMFN
jgi:hypothetical protein